MFRASHFPTTARKKIKKQTKPPPKLSLKPAYTLPAPQINPAGAPLGLAARPPRFWAPPEALSPPSRDPPQAEPVPPQAPAPEEPPTAPGTAFPAEPPRLPASRQDGDRGPDDAVREAAALGVQPGPPGAMELLHLGLRFRHRPPRPAAAPWRHFLETARPLPGAPGNQEVGEA